eukprot:snap_masked-scaffold_6-processed-gene-13.17-mRNA-1 protein AED:1.00 eAED:1.00 QI:0/-1/0/0/-1/1/1/0/532
MTPFDLFYRIRSLQDGEYEEGESKDSSLFLVGVFLYAFGAFFLAFGVVLQKYSINKEAEKSAVSKVETPKYKQPIWVLGIVLYGSSGGFMSAALGFAPQSLLSPLMSVVIVSNALLSRFLLSEPLTSRDFKCVVIIVFSVILTTLSAPSSDESPSVEDLIELYSEIPFILYCVSVVLLLLFFKYENQRGKKLLADLKTTDLAPRDSFRYSFSFGAAAGVWGGLSVTMMKSVITILVDVFDEEGVGGVFSTPLLYPLLGVLVTCWYMQLSWINTGLERYPSVFIVSIEAVLNEVVAVSGGILYFQEFKNFDLIGGIGFGVGITMGLTGIVIFALRDNTVGPDQDFFTNSKVFNCCKCCNLPQRPSSSGTDGTIRGKRKSLVENGAVVYVDENGHATDKKPDDIVVKEQIASPVSLAGAAVKFGARRAIKSIDRKLMDSDRVRSLRASLRRGSIRRGNSAAIDLVAPYGPDGGMDDPEAQREAAAYRKLQQLRAEKQGKNAEAEEAQDNQDGENKKEDGNDDDGPNIGGSPISL